MRFAVTFVLGLAGLFVHAVAAGYPIVVRYGGAEIATGQVPQAIAQLNDGTMLFGVNGLLTFNGERFVRIPMNAAYSVRVLDVGSDGKVWAGGADELGWFEGKDGEWTYHSLRDRLPAAPGGLGEFWHVFADHSGGAIFVLSDAILRWNGSEFTTWPMPGSRHLRGFRVNGDIYVQHSGLGLYRIGPAGPEPAFSAAAIGEANIGFIDHVGSEWKFVTAKGIFQWQNGELKTVENDLSAYARKHRVTSVARLSDGRLALNSIEDGIAIFASDDKFDLAIDQHAGVDERSVYSFFVDREGGLWATTNSAIFRIAISSASRLFDSRSGLWKQQVRQIEQHDGRIVLLTDDGVHQLAPDNLTFTRLNLPPGPFLDFAESSRGLLVSGLGNLWRWRDDTATSIHSTLFDVRRIFASPRGSHFIIDGRQLFEIYPDGTKQSRVAALPMEATSLVEDAHGVLWFGSLTGVWTAALRDQPLQPVRAVLPAVIGENQGRALIAQSIDGAVVLALRERVWFRAPHREQFEPVAGAPEVIISKFAPRFDRNGNLWVLTRPPAGSSLPTVARITRQNDHAIWQPHFVEGLPQIGAPRAIFVEETGGPDLALWLAGTDAVVRNVVSNGPVASRPPAPLLRALARRGPSEALRPIVAQLPFAAGTIAFELAEPDFSHRSQLRLETRIEGLDRDWLPVGPNATRELTAVRDGHYVLQARAVSETGATSDLTSFSFSVAPPWWRTAPALVGIVFALFPAAYAVYRLRLRTLRRRNLELEAKVKQRTEQLEQANAAKTQFVANMSHDIRNPLNGIVGLALALEDTQLDGPQREIVATLRECTTYLSTLVDDVLDFASIEAGRVELRPGPFVPAELLRSITTALKADTAESGARLIVDVDPALPQILSGDAGRIQQILVNYVSNALKYAGGTIHLTATIPLRSPDEVEFSVSDEGPGISATEQATLFTKFTRLAGARQHQVPGTGLGLAACRLLADIMGGSVGVESQPGHGARFYLRLPLTVATMPVAPADGELPNTTVLLVEDTDYNALAATAVLRRLGLTCERARTGAEALQLFAARRYNLVLLDRNLPDMDGIEVARGMRQVETEGLRSIILAVTAYATADDRERCLAAGMDAFVGKPLTPEKLRRVLLAAANKMLASATLEATPVAEAPATAIDTSLLNYLSDGTPAGLEAQVERFVVALHEAHTLLLHAAKAEDHHELATSAHRVLGQARMVGAAQLTTVAADLELAARAADAARCTELLRDVTREVETLTATLRRRRPGALTT